MKKVFTVFAALFLCVGGQNLCAQNLSIIKSLTKNSEETKLSILSSNFSEINGKIFFKADNGTHGAELWVSDGTEDGTKLVKDINPGGASSSPGNFQVLDNKLFFSADDGKFGREIWVSDGTEAGTKMFSNIEISKGSYPAHLNILNGYLYFTAASPVYGRELWVSDGTLNGTQIVKNISLTDHASPAGFQIVGDKMFFSAFDKSKGRELWITDGTGTGTQRVKDIRAGVGSSTPRNFHVLNNKLYFSAYDNTHGAELWVSDGTEVGTQLVKDINPGSGNAFFNYPQVFNNKFNSKLFNKKGDLNIFNDKVISYQGKNYMLSISEDIKSQLLTGDFEYAVYQPSGSHDATRVEGANSSLLMIEGKLYITAAYDESGEVLWPVELNSVLQSEEEVLTDEAAVWTIHPNPVSDYMAVTYKGSAVRSVRVVVYNHQGQPVAEQVAGRQDIRIATNDWSKGLYVAKLYEKGVLVGTKRFIVE